MSSKADITVRTIDPLNKGQLKGFIKFHYSIYRNDKNWVAPLMVDYLERLNPKKNPYFWHSEGKLFLAYKNGVPAGRLTAHENNQHVNYHKDKVGFFGFFECINDQEVADALFKSAGDWLAQRGLDTLRGPASLSVNGDPVGLLVDGFDSPPVLGMAYNPRYYPTLLENAGFVGAQDLLAYGLDVVKPNEKLVRIGDRILRDPKIRLRTPDMKNFMEEVRQLFFLYEEALSKNWGAVPLTPEELEHFSKDLKLGVDPRLTFIAEYEGKPIGLALVFKDMNQATKPAKGRLLPFGIVKILLGQRKVDIVRVAILGVLEEHRHRGFDIAMYSELMKEGIKIGYKRAELSWILESNAMMNKILVHLGMEKYKTYRMYDRQIAGA